MVKETSGFDKTHHFIAVRIAKHWNGVLKEDAEFLYSKGFKGI